jgi:methionine synthase I (cobalamin-dependent)/5,10-methylenetetrahydrofolate reductase
MGARATLSDAFLERLSRGPILCDGAMGTMLYQRTGTFEHCFDELNLSQPEWVAEIHRAYIEAGAEIIETNTFGANRFRLAEHNLAPRVSDINAAGVRIAREVAALAGRPVFIAGSIGPTGVRLSPTGSVTPDEVRAAFREQAAALADAGADLIIVETFSDLVEIEAAVRAVQDVCDLPIIAQMTFTQDLRTPVGHTPEAVAQALAALNVPVIGVNCSVGPARVLTVTEDIRAALHAAGLDDRIKVSAQPNAGWPEVSGGRIMYRATPEYFGDYARRFVLAGATIIGGCCGTTPAHISAMRLTLNALALAPQRKEARVVVVQPPSRQKQPLPPEPPTQLARKLERGEFVVNVEVSPPKGFDPSRVLAGALMLKQEGADVISVADSPRARLRMSPWAVAHLIQTQVGIETILHFPTRGRNLLRVQSDLLAAHALHVRNLFVVMGDPPNIGDYPEATDQYDVVPTGLVRLIKRHFNQGVDQAGAPIGRPCSFLVGVALNLSAQDVDKEIKLLRKKMESGADFALTQAVFDIRTVRAFLDRYHELHGPLTLPLLVGVLPLASGRHAEFLHNEVPGMYLPEEVRRRMHLAGERGREEGIRMAQDLLLGLKELVRGVYIMPAFGRYDTAAEVISVLQQTAPPSAA